MFKRRGPSRDTDRSVAADVPRGGPVAVSAPQATTARDTSETRRAARTDLLAGIGSATVSNLGLAKILRDAFGLIDEMAAFSTDFDTTAEMTRRRAQQFVASVDTLQSQSGVIEERLAMAAAALAGAHAQSQSALTSVADLTSSINDIERVIRMIASIATHTNLLALNATIEAARAGAAGTGFTVVANEVKALSQQTERATEQIVESVNRIRKRALANMTEVKGFDDTVESIESAFDTIRASILAQGEQTRDIGSGSGELATLAEAVRSSAARMQALGGTAKRMTTLAETAAGTARHAFATLTDRAAIVLRLGGGDEVDGESRWPLFLPATLTTDGRAFPVHLIDLSKSAVQIETGVDFPSDRLGETVAFDVDGIGHFKIQLLTPTAAGYEALLIDPPSAILDRIATEVLRLRVRYQPYIDRVCAVAGTINRVLDQGVDDGTLLAADLFDASYRRDGSTEPAQYRNAAVIPLEACARATLEAALSVSPHPDFCILQDRNGFNPIHNLRYSQPPRSDDIVWNIRYSRMRRIFDDRAGMAASRNLKPFFVQSYPRDMGDLVELRMEFDAPVFVKGRHWGAVRMAYKVH